MAGTCTHCSARIQWFSAGPAFAFHCVYPIPNAAGSMRVISLVPDHCYGQRSDLSADGVLVLNGFILGFPLRVFFVSLWIHRSSDAFYRIPCTTDCHFARGEGL